MLKKQRCKCITGRDFLIGEFDDVFLVRSQWIRALTIKDALSTYNRLLEPDPSSQVLILKIEESH